MATKPLLNSDLEAWRLNHQLKVTEMCNLFGIAVNGWVALMSKDNIHQPIKDNAVAMLLRLYMLRPELAPVPTKVDLVAFCEFLGLNNNLADKRTFARLLGRSFSIVYRAANRNAKASMPVVRWIEQLQRLKLSPRDTLALMKRIADDVGADDSEEIET